MVWMWKMRMGDKHFSANCTIWKILNDSNCTFGKIFTAVKIIFRAPESTFGKFSDQMS